LSSSNVKTQQYITDTGTLCNTGIWSNKLYCCSNLQTAIN